MAVFYFEFGPGPGVLPALRQPLQYPVSLPDPDLLCVAGRVKNCFQVDMCGNVILKTKEPIVLINSNQLQVSQIRNQVVPSEGPKAVPVLLDFSNTDTWDVDVSQLQQLGFLSMVQSLYVDMALSDNPMVCSVNGIGQKLVFKPGTQGYYTILCPNPVKLEFKSTQGGVQIQVFLINTPIAGATWPTK